MPRGIYDRKKKSTQEAGQASSTRHTTPADAYQAEGDSTGLGNGDLISSAPKVRRGGRKKGSKNKPKLPVVEAPAPGAAGEYDFTANRQGHPRLIRRMMIKNGVEIELPLDN